MTRIPRAVASVPLLVVYLLVLAGSPIGRWAVLELHVTAQHQGAPPASPSGHHEPDASHEHEHHHASEGSPGAGGHAHADEPHHLAAAASAPHEHGGRIHTHDPASSEEPAAPVTGLSRHHASAPVTIDSFPSRVSEPAGYTPLDPPALSRLVETPPPRPSV